MNSLYSESNKEQYAFASYLNDKIDPKLPDGTSAKSRSIKRSQEALRGLMGQLTPAFLGLMHEAALSKEFKQAHRVAQEGNIDSALEITIRKLNSIVIENFMEYHAKIPADPTSDGGITRALVSGLGGLHNALQMHFALLRVAYKILAKKIQDAPDILKSEFKRVVKNIPHTAKEMARIHAMTIKLIENMNGSKSNQREPYNLREENFDLYSYQGASPYLLPTMKFLDEVIGKANASGTLVWSASPVAGTISRDDFAEKYSEIAGCPMFGAEMQLKGNTYDAFATYFDLLDRMALLLLEPIAG